MKRHTAISVFMMLITLALANGARAQGTWAEGATLFGMIGITPGTTLQLNLVANQPGPCSAVLAFQDSNGNPLGTTWTGTLAGGESTSLALNGNTVAKPGERVEVLPTVVTEGTFSPEHCLASAEVIDNLLGVTIVGIIGDVGYPPQPYYEMLGVTPLQTVRVNVIALSGSPCVAQLSLADKNGNQVRKPLSVNLSSGQATFLDIPGTALFPPNSTLVLGQRAEALPMITVASPLPGDSAPNACMGSVEVYNNLTLRTITYYPPNPCYGFTSCAH